MPKERVYGLEAVRTDGWFERIGEGIGSFQALCEIVGEAFFAFSMITGARITALTVDRRNPDNTIVDFVVGAPSDEEVEGADPQRLTLADFRQRLALKTLLMPGGLGSTMKVLIFGNGIGRPALAGCSYRVRVT